MEGKKKQEQMISFLEFLDRQSKIIPLFPPTSRGKASKIEPTRKRSEVENKISNYLKTPPHTTKPVAKPTLLNAERSETTESPLPKSQPVKTSPKGDMPSKSPVKQVVADVSSLPRPKKMSLANKPHAELTPRPKTPVMEATVHQMYFSIDSKCSREDQFSSVYNPTNTQPISEVDDPPNPQATRNLSAEHRQTPVPDGGEAPSFEILSPSDPASAPSRQAWS